MSAYSADLFIHLLPDFDLQHYRLGYDERAGSVCVTAGWVEGL